MWEFDLHDLSMLSEHMCGGRTLLLETIKGSQGSLIVSRSRRT